MKILILTGRFGMGHWSASQSLCQQLTRTLPRAQVKVCDLFAYAMPNRSEALYKAFHLLVTYGSGLFNTYYRVTEHLPTDLNSPLDRPMLDKLDTLLEEEAPDAVIATHPICAGLTARWKEEQGSDLPLITCVTDLSTHNEWIHQSTDCYLVGSPEIRRRLMAKGVEESRILVTGIPVKEEFRRLSRHQGGSTRRLLIMGGGLGLLPRRESFYEALNALPGVEVTILTGNNQRLFRRLNGRYPHIEVVPFTDRVWDYMAQADVMLTKPGGITVFESIFAELPLLLWEPFLQQEKNNAQFLLREGLGRAAAKEPEQCLEDIRDLIYDDKALEDMRARMHKAKSQLEAESVSRLLAALTQNKAEGVRV
ncbi:MAG TPA: UDP-diphospho-muramoylpentapeptide beta-N-acetylglucosaminyltransferase [Candidatus Flavonifractor merdigallinarum]|uniref:UDP-diphospho-muramoylpentapeptide beta-N-acetylglucosaminyltransferase n=1 Tax=Candidatus Flavonifractor merdigallinarum TaxID=2838589 RepID=A0A9D2C070_9FIRM|nr:UDP-diphospho-muramoylpentapeptide beta-N-acetylglucosaminyltransferase [Candidatus Flavonifractor merdigallinarum]